VNIWLIQTGEPLPIGSGIRKMRIAVLADTLLERGHKVLWWSSAFEHQRKEMVSDRDRNFDISERYTTITYTIASQKNSACPHLPI